MTNTIKTIMLAAFLVPFSFIFANIQASNISKYESTAVHEMNGKTIQHNLLAKGQNNLPKLKSHRSCA